MRAWLVLLFLPLAGCLGGGPASVSPFVFDFIERGDPTPVAADSCADLLHLMNERASLEARVRIDQSMSGRYYGGFVDDMVMLESAEAGADGGATLAAAPASDAARSAEVTGTNNQEAGADEADILKTDGEWTYVLQGGFLYVLRSATVGNLTEVGRMAVGDHWGGQLLLEPRGPSGADDRLVIITHGNGPKLTGTEARMHEDRVAYGMTRVATYGLVDRAAPQLLDEVWVEGNNVGARLIDGHAYVVVHEWEPHLGLIDYVDPWPIMEARGMDWRDWERLSEEQRRNHLEAEAYKAVAHNDRILANLTLRDHMPLVLDRQGSAAVPQAINEAACQRFLTTPDDTGRSVATILSLDVAGNLDHQVTQIISGHPIVYGAPGSVVLAAASQNDWWYWAQPKLDEATNLHWFDLDGLDVVHRASGRVDGIVQDQFGIDVHADELRVATTTGTWGRWWLEDPEPMMSHLVVFKSLGKALVEQGRVGGIAPDERLWSARFTDDRAYLVTFEQIDPLWVIDLQDPRNPTILGELEIPGVSTYIHPVSDDLLLTIGIGPRENGQGLDWGSLQLSLFDISDPTKPTRADVMALSAGDGWSYSAALHEHKAFTYWDRLDMLAVPLSSSNYGEVWDAEREEWVYKEEHHIGVQLIDVDEARKELRKYGEVDQNHMLVDGQSRPCHGLEVQRTYFLGFPDRWPLLPVSVYSFSGLGVSAHDLDTLEPQDHVGFSADGCGYRYDDVAEVRPL